MLLAKLAALNKKSAKLAKRTSKLAKLKADVLEIECEFKNGKQFDEIFSILIKEEKRQLDEQNKKLAHNIDITENKIDEIYKQKKQMLNFLIYSVFINCDDLSPKLQYSIETLIGFTSDWYINGPIFLGEIGASVEEIENQLNFSEVTTPTDLLFRKQLKNFERINHSHIKTTVDEFIVFRREMEVEYY